MSPLLESHAAESDAAKGRTLLARRGADIRIKNTFIDLPNDDDQCAPFTRCYSEPQPRVSSFAVEAQLLQSDASTEASSGEEEDATVVLTSQAFSAVPAVPTIPSPPATLVWVGGATPLRTSAKAWEPPPTPLVLSPSASPTSSPTGSRKFLKELRAAVRKVEASLSQCFCITSVQACETTEKGWRITAHLRPQDMSRKEAILTCAKEALLHAATESKQLYVLGFKARPFTATTEGFAATVACVRDETSACWFAVGQGCCYQDPCQWQHPLSETMISVDVLL